MIVAVDAMEDGDGCAMGRLNEVARVYDGLLVEGDPGVDVVCCSINYNAGEPRPFETDASPRIRVVQAVSVSGQPIPCSISSHIRKAPIDGPETYA